MAVGCRELHCSDELGLHNFADFKINDLWRSHEKPPRSARCSWRHGAPFDNGDDAGTLHTLIDLPWLRLLLRRLSGRTIRATHKRHRSDKARWKDACGATTSSNRRDFLMEDASDLEKAHAQLVEQRRTIIEALAKGYERGQTEINIEMLLKIQAVIEVLDTLADEEEDEDDDDE
jgi:hypothetical protein